MSLEFSEYDIVSAAESIVENDLREMARRIGVVVIDLWNLGIVRAMGNGTAAGDALARRIEASCKPRRYPLSDAECERLAQIRRDLRSRSELLGDL